MKTGNQANNTDYDPANPPNQGHSPENTLRLPAGLIYE